MTQVLESYTPMTRLPVGYRPTPTTATYRVVLVGSHPLFRVGLRSELNRYAEFRVVAEAGTASQVIEVVSRSLANLIVVDQTRPGEALPLVRIICNHFANRIPVIVFGSSETPTQISKLRDLGVAAFASKALDGDQLCQIMRQAVQERPLATNIRPTVSQHYYSDEPLPKTDLNSSKKPLSPRETQILEVIAQGYSNKEVAQMLCISAHTLKNHLNNIFKKLDVEDRTQALMLSVRNGWVKL